MKLLTIILLSVSWSIGLQSLDLPDNAISLASSGTGIASTTHLSINPASISKMKTSQVSFSTNHWLGGVGGTSFSHIWKNKSISLNTFSVDDLELWEKANDAPLGTFSIRSTSLSLGMAFNHTPRLVTGIQVQGFYSRLYTDAMHGLVINAGVQHQLTKKLDIGAIIRNIGYVETDLLNIQLPSEVGVGTTFKLSTLNTQISTDIAYNEIKGFIYRTGISIDTGILSFYSSVNQFESNRYLSGGISFRYRHWSFTYGILTQQQAILGIPQSFQITWHY